jgi:3D (Asp-Asp-Asp) domain-containing protein
MKHLQLKPHYLNKYIFRIIPGLLLFCFFLSGCQTIPGNGATYVKPKWVKRTGAHYVYLVTTGYCPCQHCTGWRRNWKLQPVYARGRHRGKKKDVGITSDGTEAQKGILAADVTIYPYGTHMYIPGYGIGEVHDIGSGIIGKYHVDLFFTTHSEALKWGRRVLTVEIWNPEKEN